MNKYPAFVRLAAAICVLASLFFIFHTWGLWAAIAFIVVALSLLRIWIVFAIARRLNPGSFEREGKNWDQDESSRPRRVRVRSNWVGLLGYILLFAGLMAILTSQSPGMNKSFLFLPGVLGAVVGVVLSAYYEFFVSGKRERRL